MSDLIVTISKVIIIGFPIIIAITFHEAAHGFVALRFGDETALRMGRVTFNPLKHIDPIGTVLIPALLWISGAPFLFGYAKPVPVDFRKLLKPKRDMIFVAAAGPGTNILLAIVSAFLLKFVYSFFGPAAFSNELPSFWFDLVVQSLGFSIFINCLLAVFNMIPIPPLDGGRVAVGLLPPILAIPLARLERVGIFIILGLLFLLPIISTSLGYPLNLFKSILLPPVQGLMNFIGMLAGL